MYSCQPTVRDLQIPECFQNRFGHAHDFTLTGNFHRYSNAEMQNWTLIPRLVQNAQAKLEISRHPSHLQMQPLYFWAGWPSWCQALLHPASLFQVSAVQRVIPNWNKQVHSVWCGTHVKITGYDFHSDKLTLFNFKQSHACKWSWFWTEKACFDLKEAYITTSEQLKCTALCRRSLLIWLASWYNLIWNEVLQRDFTYLRHNCGCHPKLKRLSCPLHHIWPTC